MNLEGFNKLLNVFLPCVIDSTLEFINVDIMQRRPLTKQLCCSDSPKISMLSFRFDSHTLFAKITNNIVKMSGTTLKGLKCSAKLSAPELR